MHDKYYELAKREGYRARSVYKLKEIQEQFELIESDMQVCDIWAAPGSFLQYIKRIVGNEGTIIGIDIKPIDKYSQPNIHTIEHDIFDVAWLRPKIEKIFTRDLNYSLESSEDSTHPLTPSLDKRGETKKAFSLQGKVDDAKHQTDGLVSHEHWTVQFDLITSDIAPNTTGRKDLDQYASVELNIAILEFADEFLKSGGNLLLKVFKWEDFSDLTTEIKKRYTKFTEFKPYACRDRSFEEYVICFWKK